jgi:hypothetical protein
MIKGLVFWAVLAGAANFLCTVANASTYYVDANAPSDGTGTLEEPFSTIQAAADVMVAGDICYIRAGTYRETVTPAHNGAPGQPIVFEAYQGEKVVIDGSDPVTGWTQHAGAVYRAPMGWDLGPENQVFINGVMAHLARWPNIKNDADPFFDFSNYASADAGSSDGHVIDADLPPMPDNYWQGALIWANFGHKWSSFGTRVTSSSGQNLYYTRPSDLDGWWAFPGADQAEGGRGSYLNTNIEMYYLADKLEFLDAPNEWYFDHAGGTLYIQISGGSDPGNVVTAKHRFLAFDLSGKSYVEVRGVHIFASIISMENADHCIIDRIDAKYLTHHSMEGVSWALAWYSPLKGRNGIAISGYGNKLFNSTIRYSGGSCVTIDSGSNHVIDNNDIEYCNYLHSYCEGISGYAGPGTLVTRNKVWNIGRTAINPRSSIRAAYNDVAYAMQIGDDAGAIEGAGDDGNVEVAYNWVHDIGRGLAFGATPGLYTDGGGDNATYHHNVIWNIHGQDAALRINGNSAGVNNNGMFVYNNTAYNVPLSQMVISWPEGVRSTERNNSVNQAASNFVDPEHGDFRLSATATAKDAGDVIPGFTDGYVGTAPDLGAYEYGADKCSSNWTAGLATTPGPGGSNPEPIACEIPTIPVIANSGFESGNTSSWWTSGSQAIMTNYGHSGFSSEWVGPNSAFGQTVAVPPSSHCAAGAWGINWGGSADLYVNNVRGAFSSIQNSWAPASVTFITGPRDTSVSLFVQTSSDANMGFDDFQVVCKSGSATVRSPLS